jgi:hypothetical protein
LAFYAANALAPFAQLEQGLGHRAVIFREDMFAGFGAVPSAMAWLLIIYILPLVGIIAYLSFGELHLGTQLQLVAFYAANALAPFAQLEQGLGHRAVIFREDNETPRCAVRDGLVIDHLYSAAGGDHRLSLLWRAAWLPFTPPMPWRRSHSLNRDSATGLLSSAKICLQACVTLRILMKRRAVPSAMAWLLIIYILPLVGIIAYVRTA